MDMPGSLGFMQDYYRKSKLGPDFFKEMEAKREIPHRYSCDQFMEDFIS